MTSGDARLARTFAIVALVAGALAAWLVSDYTGSVERRAGRPVRVLVAGRPIARGATISPQMIGGTIVQRSIPRAFAPADAVRSIDELDGSRAITDITAGAYLTAPLFASGAAAGAGYRLRRGERAVSIDTKVAPDGADIQTGAIVDVFASGFAGGSATSLLMAGAEVLAAADASAGTAQRRLTLRVSAAQAPALIRGDVFAKELRTVIRP